LTQLQHRQWYSALANCITYPDSLVSNLSGLVQKNKKVHLDWKIHKVRPQKLVVVSFPFGLLRRSLSVFVELVLVFLSCVVFVFVVCRGRGRFAFVLGFFIRLGLVCLVSVFILPLCLNVRSFTFYLFVCLCSFGLRLAFVQQSLFFVLPLYSSVCML
jgi:hypothetical protein